MPVRATRRTVYLLSILCLATMGQAWGQSYPAKPLKLIMPFPAGSSADAIGRFYAEHLGRDLGQTVVIENKPGAGGNIGTAAAAKEPADGYSLLLATATTLSMNMFLYKNLGYDPEQDFQAIGLVAAVTMAIGVRSDMGIASLSELVEKSKTSKINLAIPSSGAEIVEVVLTSKAGSKMTAVPFNGSPAALNAIVGNHVEAIVDSAVGMKPHIESGKIIPLGVSSSTESGVVPGVKPIASQLKSLDDFEFTGWYMFCVPKGTPAPIVNRINAALKKIQAYPETRPKLISLGFDFRDIGDPADLAVFVRKQRESIGGILTSANVTPK